MAYSWLVVMEGCLMNSNKLVFNALLNVPYIIVLLCLITHSKFTFKICLRIQSAMPIARMFTEICCKGLGERKFKPNFACS